MTDPRPLNGMSVEASLVWLENLKRDVARPAGEKPRPAAEELIPADYDRGVEVYARCEQLYVDFLYPRIEGHYKSVELGLMDVRAADSIRIAYDFARDGWSIMQASRFAWAADDKLCDPDWQEVAFVEAWAREEGEHGEGPV